MVYILFLERKRIKKNFLREYPQGTYFVSLMVFK